MHRSAPSREVNSGPSPVREPHYVPVTLAAELADCICRSFTASGVRLKPLDVRFDRITLAIVQERER